MQTYLAFLKYIIDHGVEKTDRTNTGTLSVFGYDMRFNLSQGFPLVTTKKIHLKSVIHELLWFLQGNTNIHYLNDNQVNIWNDWADAQGELGPVYGAQWRAWRNADGQTIDQIAQVIEQIKQNPDSRRLIVNAWNVGEINKMALPPCHLLFQFYVAGNRLSCKLTQRSADAFLGVPFNIASYALLTHMVAQHCDLDVGDFIWSGGDCHIYLNHIEQVSEQLSRVPFAPPQLTFKRKPNTIFEYVYEDFEFINYQCHPSIKAPIAV